MNKTNIYLTFNGNCERAFDFYRSIFGGEFSYLGRFKDMPENPEFKIPEDQKDQIMHVSLAISEETVLMGSDTFGKEVIFGDNFSISVNSSTKDEADRVFNALGSEGHIVSPMQDTFWGDYFGMCKDRFGINWMVSFATKPMN